MSYPPLGEGGRKDGGMESPTSSAATENPQEPRTGGSRGSPTAAAPGGTIRVDDVVGSGRGPRPSEVPPTGALTWVLGELAFYYGACCLYHHRSAPRRGRTR